MTQNTSELKPSLDSIQVTIIKLQNVLPKEKDPDIQDYIEQLFMHIEQTITHIGATPKKDILDTMLKTTTEK